MREEPGWRDGRRCRCRLLSLTADPHESRHPTRPLAPCSILWGLQSGPSNAAGGSVEESRSSACCSFFSFSFFSIQYRGRPVSAVGTCAQARPETRATVCGVFHARQAIRKRPGTLGPAYPYPVVRRRVSWCGSRAAPCCRTAAATFSLASYAAETLTTYESRSRGGVDKRTSKSSNERIQRERCGRSYTRNTKLTTTQPA